MRRRHVSLGQQLLQSPWWVSAAIGVIGFIAMRWAIPAALAHKTEFHSFLATLIRLSPIPLILFGLFAFASTLFDLNRRRLEGKSNRSNISAKPDDRKLKP